MIGSYEAAMSEITPICLQNIETGRVYRSSARTLTETDLVMFSMITGDWHPIHSDAEYSRSTRIGQRIFHGSFGISLAISMSADLLQLVNPVIAALGIREWVFKSPLFVGDTIHAELSVEKVKMTSAGKHAVIERRISLVKHDGTVAQTGLAGLMVGATAAGDQ
jgi:acyl dehydratase